MSKDRCEAKYQFLFNKREGVVLNYCNDSKVLIEYLNDMRDIYKNIQEYYRNRKRKVKNVFYDMIVDLLSNKNLTQLVAVLFIRDGKLVSCFCYTVLFCCNKNIRLISTNYFIIKIPNKRKLQQIEINHSLDIDFKFFFSEWYYSCIR